MSDVTRVIEAVQKGDPTAGEELLPLVYQELRRLAAYKMANEAPGQTLQPTALVHEAWLRLSSDAGQQWQGRAHFFSAAAEAMRRILIDRARHKRAVRHGGELQRMDVQEIELASPAKDDDELLAMTDALDELAKEHKAEAELVKLRYFVGLSIEEAAATLGISPRTAKYYWTHARAWLYREITKAK